MAKLKITKTKRTIEEIEVNLPYYYIHHLGDEVIYGIIDSEITTTICESDNEKKYTIEQEKWLGDGSYFTDFHKSNKETYNKALERVRNFINCL